MLVVLVVVMVFHHDGQERGKEGDRKIRVRERVCVCEYMCSVHFRFFPLKKKKIH